MTALNSNNPSMRVRLIKGGKVVRSFKIKPETFTIGSGQEATVRIGGVPDLAPKHALIWLDDGVPTLVPSAGCSVFVNGAPTSHARLRPNDLVSLGKLDLQIESLADQAAQAPAPVQAPAHRPLEPVGEGGDEGLEGGATQVSAIPYPAPPPAAPPPRPSSPPWLRPETLRAFDEEEPEQATAVATPAELERLREESTTEFAAPRPPAARREVVAPPVYPSYFGEDETTMPARPAPAGMGVGAGARPARSKDLQELELTDEERQALADLLPFATPVPAQMPRSGDEEDDELGMLTAPPQTMESAPPVHEGPSRGPMPPAEWPAPRPPQQPYQQPAPQPWYAQPAPQHQQQPAPQYQQPAPQHQQPAPQYQQPAPQQYQQPAPQPQYQQPAPQHQQPAPQYEQPAPQHQQPAPQPQVQQPAPQPLQPRQDEQRAPAEPQWFDRVTPGPEQAPAVPSSEPAAPGERPRVFEAALPFRFPAAKGDGSDPEDEPIYVPPKRVRRHVRRDVFERLVAAPVTKAEGHVPGTLAAEVICQGEGRLWEIQLVEPGTAYPPEAGQAALVRMGRGGQCAVAAPKRATGSVWIKGVEQDLRKQPIGPDGLRQVVLGEGDRALINERKDSYLVTVTREARTDRSAILNDIHLLEEASRQTKGASVRLGRFVSLLMVLALAAGIVVLVITNPAAGGPIFEEMSLVDVALAPGEDEPEEQEEAEASDDAAAAVAAAVASPVRRQARGGGGKASSTNSLLQQLRGGGGSGGGPSLQDVIGNINSIGSSTPFGGVGLLPGLPGEHSGPFSKGGGGGGVSTLGGGQLGKGIGQVEGSGGKRGKIRGRVQNVSSQARVQGNLDRAEVLRVINGRMGAITRCYESRLMSNPTLSGRLVFGWTITTSGGVSGVAVRSSTLPDPAVASCISGIIRGMRFPRPDGGSVQISFPFLFRAMDI